MYPKETNNGNSKLRYERTFTLAPKIQKLKNTKKGQLCTGMRQRLALTTHDGLDVLRYYSTMFFECNNRNREHCPVPAFDRYLQIFVLPLPDSNTAVQQQQQKMDDKNSSLFIDPYKFPSDEDIKKKWHTWQGSEKACEGAAIKWLKCMSITKAGFLFVSVSVCLLVRSRFRRRNT